MAVFFINRPMLRKHPNNMLCKKKKYNLKPSEGNYRSVLLKFTDYFTDPSLAGNNQT